MKNLSRISTFSRILPLLIAPLALTATTVVAPTAAHAQKDDGQLEAWPGQRVLLLLPLQLGAGFNVDRAFGQAILSQAESSLQAALQKTGKFSVIEAHTHNPILQRALSERRITPEQLKTLVTSAASNDEKAALDSARLVLGLIGFDQPPMIARFALEEVRLSGTEKNTQVQTQVSGRLYELTNPVAIKSTVITSNAQRARRVSQATLAAAADAFAMTAGEFTAPIPEVTLELPATAAPVAEPATPAPVATPAVPAPTQTPASKVTLPGDVPIAGASSRLPSDVVSRPAAPAPAGR
jgi:hypothetical protein